MQVVEPLGPLCIWTQNIEMENGLFMMNHMMFRSTNNAGCILFVSHI